MTAQNGGFSTRAEGRNFSSSVIHYDMNHQMMCLYAGEKEWITWDSHSQVPEPLRRARARALLRRALEFIMSFVANVLILDFLVLFGAFLD